MSGQRSLPRAWTREGMAVLAVVVVMGASWLLVHGTATAVYRHFGSFGTPPLALIRAPGPDPDPGVRGRPGQPVSQLGNIGYFWSERAFHYRTVLMFATGEYHPPALLSHDTSQQYPDGVDAWREYTLFMEPLYGGLYRLCGDTSRPVVEFLLVLVPLVHVLLFLPLYAIARALGAGRVVAVGAVAVYASCRLGFARLAGSLLLKEDLALLLLLGFVAAHLWAWRRGRVVSYVLAGVLLTAVLASWHLSQFLVGVVLGSAAVVRAVRGPGEAQNRSGWLPLTYVGAGGLAACTPTLAERAFWLSPPFALLVAWALAELLPRRWPALAATGRRRVGLLCGGVVLLVGVALVNRAYAGDYGHVGGLLASKLQHGLRPPADPGALPFAARVFWTTPFHTPGWGEIWRAVGLQLPLLALGVVWAAVHGWRPRTDPASQSVLAVVPVFAAGWLLAARLGVVFLPFGAVAAALAVAALLRAGAGNRGRVMRPAWAGGVALLLVAAVNVPVHLGDDARLARDTWRGRAGQIGASDDAKARARAELFAWVRGNTAGPGGPAGGRPAAFLGDIGLSPQLLLYCDRPVVLNSQFENAPIRARYQRYLAALFAADEAALHAFAREMRADYLIVDRDQATSDGHGSLVYVAGVAGPLSLGTTAARLHFAPQTLHHFTPVYDNDVYRVFRVEPSPPSTVAVAWPGQASLWWRLANYTVADGYLVDPAGDRARLAAIEQGVAQVQDEQQRLLAPSRRPAQGREPAVLDLRRHVVLARLADGDDAVGAESARIGDVIESRLQQTDPHSGRTVRQALAALANRRAPLAGGEPLFGDRAADPLHLAIAGQLQAVLGRFDEAADLFRRATDFWPEGRAGETVSVVEAQLRDETVCWLLAAGRTAQARLLAERWQRELPAAMQRDSFIARLLATAATTEVAVR